MRKFLRNGIVLFGSVFLAGLVGCGPELAKEDLGTVTFELPKFDGDDAGKKADNKKAENKKAEKSTEKSASEAVPGNKDKEAANETAKPQDALADPNAAAAQQKDPPAAEQKAAPAKQPTEPNATPAEPAK